MATNENPLGIFPFSKEQLETLLARGTLVEAVRRYRNNAARLLHPDTGGKDFVEYGLPEDGVFKVLNGAFEQIEHANAAQLQQWVNMYGNGGGISEEQVARILAGAEVLRDQRDTLQTEKAGLEQKLADLVAAISHGQNIPETRLREMLAGRGGADPAIVRQLEARVANAEQERDRYRNDVNATARDRDAAQRRARDLNTELDAMRRDKIAKQREADVYKGQRDAAQTNAVNYERIANAHKKQANGLEQTLKDVRESAAREHASAQSSLAAAGELITQQMKRFEEAKAAGLSKTPIGPLLNGIREVYEATKNPALLALLEKTADAWAQDGLIESAAAVYASLISRDGVQRGVRPKYAALLERQGTLTEALKALDEEIHQGNTDPSVTIQRIDLHLRRDYTSLIQAGFSAYNRRNMAGGLHRIYAAAKTADDARTQTKKLLLGHGTVKDQAVVERLANAITEDVFLGAYPTYPIEQMLKGTLQSHLTAGFLRHNVVNIVRSVKTRLDHGGEPEAVAGGLERSMRWDESLVRDPSQIRMVAQRLVETLYRPLKATYNTTK